MTHFRLQLLSTSSWKEKSKAQGFFFSPGNIKIFSISVTREERGCKVHHAQEKCVTFFKISKND